MTKSRSALLVSIRPKFAKMIIDGRKTVELRRVRPGVDPDAVVFIYATMPIQSVVAVCLIERIVSDSQNSVWEQVRKFAGISRSLFDDYYAGSSAAHAIFLQAVTCVPKPVTLTEILREWPNFRPPQSYRYIPMEKLPIFGFMPADVAAPTSVKHGSDLLMTRGQLMSLGAGDRTAPASPG